jgi:hypothetical protein
VLYYAPPGAYFAPQSYGGYYTYPPLATPFAPSVTSSSPLFGIQTTPAVYSPSPVPYYSSPSSYSLPSSPVTLFGSPSISPQAAVDSALYARTPAATPYGGAYSSGAYVTTAYGPALSPSPSASPYYGMAATGEQLCPVLTITCFAALPLIYTLIHPIRINTCTKCMSKVSCILTWL